MTKLTKSPKEAAPTILDSDWLTLAETKDRLKASQSTVERRVEAGALKTKFSPRPGRKPEKLYRRADVERLEKEEEAGNSRSPSPVVAMRKPPTSELALSPTTFSAIGDLMKQWGTQLPLREKLWLSLAEAAAYSGLGEGYLMGLLETGKVHAVKGGPHGQWRIGRVSLDGYTGER